MALLSSVFQSLNLNPDIYYAFLEDLREDSFTGGIKKICLEVKELYPNTNLVALIREKSTEWILERCRRREDKEPKKLEKPKEIDYEKCEEARQEWKELIEKLAREKGIN